jgi:hypothetical protein
MTELDREPLSWLILERYALGELDEQEQKRVEAQLATSPEDRACLLQIQSETNALPPLPVVVLRPRRTPRPGWWLLSTGIAAAAASLLLFMPPSGTLPPSSKRLTHGTKGGELAMQLVSERQGEGPRTYSVGERFKLLVTCPPWLVGTPRILVFQAGKRYEPLRTTAHFACGNLVPIPGAFALDGSEPAEVCVAWGQPAEHAEHAEQLGAQAVCTRLERQ